MGDSPNKKRSMKETTAAVSLPDDVVLEILIHTKNDRAALFRSATVCKQWSRLIADPSFLRRCWPTKKEIYSFAGFFAQKRNHLETEEGFAPILGPSFVPAPRSAISSGRRALVSFLPSVPASLLDYAEPLAVRHGIVLLRLDASQSTTTAHLAVCNPLAGTCQLLPPLKWDYAYSGYAILTDGDCYSGGPQQPTVSYFKVLVVAGKYDVYTFSSKEVSWSRTSNKCFDGLRIHIFERNAVVCGGTAQWLAYNFEASCLCTIDVNAETGHVSTRKLVTNLRQFQSWHHFNEPFLSVDVDDDSTLSMIWMKDKCLEVEIWKQQDNKEGIDEEHDDDDTSTWHCTRVIELKQPHNVEIQGVLRILGEKGGTLLVNDVKQRVYIAHLETGILEECIEWPWGYLGLGEARPFEVDWLALFVSRLGGR